MLRCRFTSLTRRRSSLARLRSFAPHAVRIAASVGMFGRLCSVLYRSIMACASRYRASLIAQRMKEWKIDQGKWATYGMKAGVLSRGGSCVPWLINTNAPAAGDAGRAIGGGKCGERVA